MEIVFDCGLVMNAKTLDFKNSTIQMFTIKKKLTCLYIHKATGQLFLVVRSIFAVFVEHCE